MADKVRVLNTDGLAQVFLGDAMIGRVQEYTIRETVGKPVELQLRIAAPQVDLEIPSDQVTVDLQVGFNGEVLRFKLEDLRRLGHEIFSINDEVYLRSGGPLMVVKEVRQGICDCSWTCESGTPQIHSFSSECLTKINPN